MVKNILLSTIVILGIVLAVCFIVSIKKNSKKPPTNWEWSNEWKKPIVQIPINPDIVKPITAKTYKEAIEIAGREKKLVLVFFTSPHCIWCESMKKTINTEEVKSITQKYITVTVDVSIDLITSKKWNLIAVPSHLITDLNESKLKFKSGTMSSQDYINWIN